MVITSWYPLHDECCCGNVQWYHYNRDDVWHRRLRACYIHDDDMPTIQIAVCQIRKIKTAMPSLGESIMRLLCQPISEFLFICQKSELHKQPRLTTSCQVCPPVAQVEQPQFLKSCSRSTCTTSTTGAYNKVVVSFLSFKAIMMDMAVMMDLTVMHVRQRK